MRVNRMSVTLVNITFFLTCLFPFRNGFSALLFAHLYSIIGRINAQELIELIQVQHFTKKFGEKTVVRDISFTARDGAITGFIGHNGAGKSTTIKAITGVIQPTEGTILINGVDIVKKPRDAKRLFGDILRSRARQTDVEETVAKVLLLNEYKGIRMRCQGSR